MRKISKILAGALVFLCAILTGLGVCDGIPSITFDDTGDTIIVTYQGLDSPIFQNIQVTSGVQQSGAPYATDPTRPLVEFGRITFFVADNESFVNPSGASGYLAETFATTPPQISDILNVVHLSITPAGSTPIGTRYDYFLESDYLGGSPQLIPGFSIFFGGLETGIPPQVGDGVTDSTGATYNISLNIFSDVDNPDVEPVPEPTTMLLLGSGLLGLWGARKKFKK